MKATLTCPQCTQELQIDRNLLGGKIRCPLCHTTFETAAPATEHPLASATPDTAASQPLSDPVMDALPVEATTTAPALGGGWERVPPAEEGTLWVEPAEPLPDDENYFESIPFRVRVEWDPSRRLEGELAAELSPAGLRLRYGKRWQTFPPGTRAAYLRGNRFWVEIHGREVELGVLEPANHRAYLAEKVADFLSGLTTAVRLPRHRVPWYVILPALAPLLIPAIAIPLGTLVEGGWGACLWGGLGLFLTLICVLMVLLIRWPPAFRIVSAGIVSLFGFFLLGMGLFADWMLTPPAIPPSAWRTAVIPEANCQVLLPGVPRYQSASYYLGPGARAQGVSLNRQRLTFLVAYRNLSNAEKQMERSVVFQRILSQSLQRRRARLVRHLPFSRDHYAGEEWTVTSSSSRYRTTIARAFLVNKQRLYLLLVHGSYLQPGDADADRFLRSFRLLPSNNPPVPPPPNPPPVRPGLLPQPAPPLPPGAPTRLQAYPRNGFLARVEHLAVNPAGTRLATLSQRRNLKIWDVANKEEIRSRSLPRPVATMQVSPDGKALVLASSSTLTLFDGSNGRQIAEFQGAKRGITALAFHTSPQGSITLAVGEAGNPFAPPGQVHLWDLAARKELRAFPVNQGTLQNLAFSPDGLILATVADQDKRVRLWEVATGREIARLAGHTGNVRAVAFHPEGKWLASGGDDRSVRIWDLASGQTRFRLLGHKTRVRQLAFLADGKTLVSVDERRILFWDLPSRKLLHTLQPQPWAQSFALAPTGKLLCAGLQDGGVLHWQLDQLQALAQRPAPVPLPPLPPGIAAEVPELQWGEPIEPFVCADADTQGGSLLLLTREGNLCRYTYPDFQKRGTYPLGQPGYRCVLDSRKGLLYVASTDAKALEESPGGGYVGVGNVTVYQVQSILEGKQEEKPPLEQVAVIPVGWTVHRLLLSPDSRWLYLLAEEKEGALLGKIDTSTYKWNKDFHLPAGTRLLTQALDGKALYTAGPGKEANLRQRCLVQRLDPMSLQPTREESVDGSPQDLMAGDDGHLFLCARGRLSGVRILNWQQPDVRVIRWPRFGVNATLRLAPEQKRFYVLGPSRLEAYELPEQITPIRPSPLETLLPRKERPALRGECVLTPDGKYLLLSSGAVIRLAAAGMQMPPS